MFYFKMQKGDFGWLVSICHMFTMDNLNIALLMFR